MEKISYEKAQELVNKGETPASISKVKVDNSHWKFIFKIFNENPNIPPETKIFKIESFSDELRESATYKENSVEFLIEDLIINTELLTLITLPNKILTVEKHNIIYDDDLNIIIERPIVVYDNCKISAEEINSQTGKYATIRYRIKCQEVGKRIDTKRDEADNGTSYSDLIEKYLNKARNSGDLIKTISETYNTLSGEGKIRLCEDIAGKRGKVEIPSVIEDLKADLQIKEIVKTCVMCYESFQEKPTIEITKNSKLLKCNFHQIKSDKVCPKCGCNVFSVEMDLIVNLTPETV
jgi:hypothetical protein